MKENTTNTAGVDIAYTAEEQKRAEQGDGVQRRTNASAFEVREVEDGAPVVSGYAAIFDTPTRIGSFTEVIARGAFDEALETADVRALFNHDANQILARRHADGTGTLKLSTDEHGLRYEFSPGDQTYARDLVESMRRGDVSASSFAFTIEEQTWDDKRSTRTVEKVGTLVDISPVVFPAYAETSASVRAEDQPEAHAQETSQTKNETQAKPQQERRELFTQPNTMKDSNSLKELRGKNFAEYEALTAKAEAEGREMTEAEAQRADHLELEILRIDEKLKRAVAKEDMVARLANFGGASKSEQREAAKIHSTFSLARAASQIIQRGHLDGAEAEWKQEADKEAQRAGIRLEGNIAIPEVALRADETDQFAATATAAADAGGPGFVGTQVGAAIAALREPTLVESLGATVIRNATSNLQFPRISTKAGAGWLTEVADDAVSGMQMDSLSLTPKRVGCETKYSRQLLIQGGASVDAVIAQDIALAINAAIDTAAFSGSGSSGQPTGILSTTGIVDNSTANANTTDVSGTFLTMEQDLLSAGALNGARYVCSPTAHKLLKESARVSNVAALYEYQGNLANGYPVVPTGYLADSAAGVGQVVMANFSNLLLVYFGSGLDLLVDPYSAAGTSQIKLHASRFVDLACRQPGAFSVCTDLSAD